MRYSQEKGLEHLRNNVIIEIPIIVDPWEQMNYAQPLPFLKYMFYHNCRAVYIQIHNA